MKHFSWYLTLFHLGFWYLFSLEVFWYLFSQNCPRCHKSSLANALIMKLGRLEDKVKCGLLIYNFLLYFFWSQQKSVQIRVLLKGLFLQNKNSFLQTVFCKKHMIANKMFFQNIYRWNTFWLVYVVLSRPKINEKTYSKINKSMK